METTANNSIRRNMAPTANQAAEHGPRLDAQKYWASLNEDERYWSTAARYLAQCGYQVSDERLALAATWHSYKLSRDAPAAEGMPDSYELVA